MLNFMIAGRDTTSCVFSHCVDHMCSVVYRVAEKTDLDTQGTLTNVLRNLSENSHVVERIRGECLCAVDTGYLTYDDAKKVPYVDAIFNETIRLVPPVGMMLSRAELYRLSEFVGLFVSSSGCVAVHMDDAH